jgi:hypothetical protein
MLTATRSSRVCAVPGRPTSLPASSRLTMPARTSQHEPPCSLDLAGTWGSQASATLAVATAPAPLIHPTWPRSTGRRSPRRRAADRDQGRAGRRQRGSSCDSRKSQLSVVALPGFDLRRLRAAREGPREKEQIKMVAGPRFKPIWGAAGEGPWRRTDCNNAGISLPLPTD